MDIERLGLHKPKLEDFEESLEDAYQWGYTDFAIEGDESEWKFLVFKGKEFYMQINGPNFEDEDELGDEEFSCAIYHAEIYYDGDFFDPGSGFTQQDALDDAWRKFLEELK